MSLSREESPEANFRNVNMTKLKIQRVRTLDIEGNRAFRGRGRHLPG
jgi:hypothetical protein